ncbi:Fic family protein [Mitsuaria sp. PDC51]|uniref:Fic family protein n=1 Tax=Mitsuaria sp. PDC51 TaxID=1881035 RepID=UPI0008EBE6EA|nr:Fic family protein [Mitsuaria sp. PDC51]SFR71442.1 Fic family protein [Mitsuaria sp. PDC51]
MRRGLTGTYEYSIAGGETCQAFVPLPLPPQPALSLDADLQERLNAAHLALGRLDGLSLLMPETSVLLYSYVRKEAVMSSRIEGTQSSLADLLIYEADGAPGSPLDDVREVSCYVAALEHGRDRMRQGMPLCTRLMNDMHRRLMTQGRGRGKAPGELRRTQNWIGGASAASASFVPPPPHRLEHCLSDLERFINDQPERHPSLVKAAMAHLQFETIHPYLDGNGRLGRLLIPLILVSEGVLREPLLYLSLYFKSCRNDYYDLLQAVREHGDWESWLSFFATAVQVAAMQAVEMTLAITRLFTVDGARIRREARADEDALRLHHALFSRPVARRVDITAFNGQDAAAIDRGARVLTGLGLLRTVFGTAGEPIYVYTAYLDLLNREAP